MNIKKYIKEDCYSLLEIFKENINSNGLEDIFDEYKSFVILQQKYDIEFVYEWLGVKIFDRSNLTAIDPISKSKFKSFISSCSNHKHIVRSFLHIIEPRGKVIPHKDTEDGYQTENIEVLNYIILLDPQSNIKLEVCVDNEVYDFLDYDDLLFDAQNIHSAINLSDSFLGFLVFHIEKDFYEKKD